MSDDIKMVLCIAVLGVVLVLSVWSFEIYKQYIISLAVRAGNFRIEHVHSGCKVGLRIQEQR